MRRFFFVLFCVSSCINSLFAASITPAEAGRHIGEELELRGNVFAVSWSGGEGGKRTQYLNFGDAYPRQEFTVQFRPDLIPGGEWLPNLFKREVTIRGKVEKGTHGPRMLLKDAAQIEVIPVDETAALNEAGETRVDGKSIGVAWSQIMDRDEFDKIEKEATRIQREQPRLQDGLWLVDTFYESLAATCERTPDRSEKMLQRLDRWDAKYPKSSTARLVRGMFLIDYAWNARGGGYANTVTKEGWEKFGQRLAEAHKVLLSVPKQDRAPTFYCQLITLAMGEGWSQNEVTPYVVECTERWPDYPNVYFNECYRLLPRWAGEDGEWESFLDRATATKTLIANELYARTVWAQSRYYNENIFKETKADWVRTKAGFEEMRRKYPESWKNLNAYAKFAAMAGDKKTASEIARLINGHEDIGFWVSWSNYEHFTDWVNAPEAAPAPTP